MASSASSSDHPLFRKGIIRLLSSLEDLEVVAQAATGDEAVAAALEHQPDVVVMDLRMPELDGVEATRRIVAASPHIRVLVLTMSEDDASVFAAMRAGALGYLIKETDEEDIARAVRSVASGEAVFGPAVARRVIQYFTTPAMARPSPVFPELTDREREVLESLRYLWRSQDGVAPAGTPVRRTAKAVVVMALATVVGSAAVAGAGPAQHWQFPVAGEELADCPSGTYTITRGSMAVTAHHDGEAFDPREEPAEGETVHFVMVLRPVRVELENETGERFRLVGAEHLSFNYSSSGEGWVATGTQKMSIVRWDGGGGVVEQFNTVARLRDGQLVSFELGSCHWP